MAFFVFVYGLLMSFVLSSCSYNRRAGRPDTPIVQWTGYVLVGLTAGIALMLLCIATVGMEIPFETI